MTLYMDKKKDHLFIFNVHEETRGMYDGYAAPDLINSLSDVEERRAKKVLVHYGHKAKLLGISYTMMKGASYHAGDLICKAVKQYNIQTVVVGRRDMGDFKRFFVGSTSKYIVENAECNVIVIKSSIGPEEEHADKQKIIQAEEAERLRRIEEDEELKHKEEEDRQSTLKKVIRDEEKERKERIREENPGVVDKLFHLFSWTPEHHIQKDK